MIWKWKMYKYCRCREICTRIHDKAEIMRRVVINIVVICNIFWLLNTYVIFEYFLPYESCLPKVDTKKLPWKTFLPKYRHMNNYQVHPLRIPILRGEQCEELEKSSSLPSNHINKDAWLFKRTVWELWASNDTSGINGTSNISGTEEWQQGYIHQSNP